MGLHQHLVSHNRGYARWHNMPYATVLHFLALTIFLSATTLYLQDRLVERVEEMTTGQYNVDAL